MVESLFLFWVLLEYGWDAYGCLLFVGIARTLQDRFGTNFYPVWFAPAIDYRWAWAGNLFSFIGGGSVVLKSMLYAMVSDVASEDQRYLKFISEGVHNR